MSEKDKLIHAAKLMGITACRHRDGGGLRESIERDVLEFYEGAGITFPDGFVALLESHVKWLNEEDPILISFNKLQQESMRRYEEVSDE
tara:strand:+ start:62 stop:328 length:267 start_codon:yes stop_codon:yes gene_type:complete